MAAAGELAKGLYRQMHVVLVPSLATQTWVEQFGRVIVEAQASGAVVAGYASGSIPEIAGDSAILVPERAVNDLSQELSVLISNQEEYETLRDRGLRLARSRTWSRVAGRQAELYRRALAQGAPENRHRYNANRRAAARVEFGTPARTPAGDRPFALPLLRRGGAMANLLAWAIDIASAARDRRRG